MDKNELNHFCSYNLQYIIGVEMLWRMLNV